MVDRVVMNIDDQSFEIFFIFDQLSFKRMNKKAASSSVSFIKSLRIGVK